MDRRKSLKGSKGYRDGDRQRVLARILELGVPKSRNAGASCK